MLTCSKETAYACSSFLAMSESPASLVDEMLRMEERLVCELEGVRSRVDEGTGDADCEEREKEKSLKKS